MAPDLILVDGTHIKANANPQKQVKAAIPVAAKAYEKQLREEINGDREQHGKNPFDDDLPGGATPVREITQSMIDPESGLLHKGEHKNSFAYSAQAVCDKHNYVLGVEVTPGNLHDSMAFNTLYGKVTKRFPEIAVIAANAAYKTPWICKQILDNGQTPSMPYKRPMTKKGNPSVSALLEAYIPASILFPLCS